MSTVNEPYSCERCEDTGVITFCPSEPDKCDGCETASCPDCAPSIIWCDWCERFIEVGKDILANFGGRFCSDECATNYAEGVAVGDIKKPV